VSLPGAVALHPGETPPFPREILFRFQIKDEIKAARKRRRGILQQYVEEPMTKPTMIAL
jgi:hypothetical protein